MSERFGKREFTNLPIRAVGIPIVRDVSMLPMFPERLDVNMTRAGVGQDTFEGTVGAVAHADQRTENVERYQLRPPCRVRIVVHQSNSC